jgi:cilia- and flagella-associated protein 57
MLLHISQVSFNPQDNTQLCVVGNGIFKLFRYSEGSLKQFAFQKLEPQNYLSQAWVSDERVIVGTESGRLLLFESGELKTEFNLALNRNRLLMDF